MFGNGYPASLILHDDFISMLKPVFLEEFVGNSDIRHWLTSEKVGTGLITNAHFFGHYIFPNENTRVEIANLLRKDELWCLIKSYPV